MKKITPVQMVSILICCLFARLMTYIPSEEDNAVLLFMLQAYINCRSVRNNYTSNQTI